MSDRDSALFNFVGSSTPRRKSPSNFSKMPVIRTFESLLTDEELASAGFRVAAHPAKNTFYIYPASEHLTTDDNNRISLNPITSSSYVTYHHSLWVDPSAPSRPAKVDLTPISKRLDDLRAIAIEEEVPFNDVSAKDAVEWLSSVTPDTLPNVFLVNNGNIRVLWLRGHEQLGIQFLGHGNAQFVFLGEDDQTEQIFGAVKVTDLLKRINGLDLSSIVGFDPVEWPSKAVRTSFVTLADHSSTEAS